MGNSETKRIFGYTLACVLHTGASWIVQSLGNPRDVFLYHEELYWQLHPYVDFGLPGFRPPPNKERDL